MGVNFTIWVQRQSLKESPSLSNRFFVVKTRPKEKQTRLKLNQQLVSNHQQWFPKSKTIESNGAPEKQKATFVGQSLHWCLDFLDLCLKVFSAGLLPNCKVVPEGAKSHLS